MKIQSISMYRVELPLNEGSYNWSGGKSVRIFDSTVVAVETDAGLTGYGEVCPLGASYLPAFAAGARTAIAELAPQLLGEDPTQLQRINRLMDSLLQGHPYAKSPLDMAFWDLLGQACSRSLCELLGGRYGPDFVLYRAISQDSPQAMAERVKEYRREGYRRFQLKVGSDVESDVARIRLVAEQLHPGDRLVADANTGWSMHEASRVIRSVRDLDLYIEQPCPTYLECRSIRSRTDLPFILDESIDGLAALLRAHADGALDVVNLKLGKLGGLTRTRQLRDLCIELGIAMTIEDSWGSDISTAAIAHLAHSTPPEFLFSSTDFNSYVNVSTAAGAPKRRGGRLAAPTAAGLGIKPRPQVLGDPVGRWALPG